MHETAVNTQEEEDHHLQKGHFLIDQVLFAVDIFVGIIEDEYQHHQHNDGKSPFERPVHLMSIAI